MMQKDPLHLPPLANLQLGANLTQVIRAIQNSRALPASTAPLGNCECPAPALEQAQQLVQLIEGLNLEYGYERSFKLSEGRLLSDRFLVGIEKKQVDPASLLNLCQQMNMPEEYREAFQANLPAANVFGFGFEGTETSCLYKAYLEFWEQIQRDLEKPSNKIESALMYLGFKWDPYDRTRKATSQYTYYPSRSVQDILRCLFRIYSRSQNPDRTSTDFAIVEEMIHYAAAKNPQAPLIYVEVNEEGNPRKSFDINLYGANLQIKDVYPILMKAFRNYFIAEEELQRLYDQICENVLGHLSGGLDREGQSFLTLYYEIEGLPISMDSSQGKRI